MSRSHIAPYILLLWITGGQSQYYDPPPYGLPPYFDPLPPYSYLPEGAPYPQGPILPPQQYPSATSFNNFNLNPFLPGQGQKLNTQQQQQQQQQKVQGSYPNLPSVPFQTVSPNNNFQRVDRYPFLGSGVFDPNNANTNPNSLNNINQQQPAFPNQPYPNLPSFPFQTVSPGQGQISPNLIPQINNYPPNVYQKPKIELPRIRVIEFPSSEYFEYGGGKLVMPKRPNADLYVGGSGGDVPLTSKIFIECTGPNQVEWLFNSANITGTKKELSVVTKNFQITIPEQRGPTPKSKEYTYLRLGLEDSISANDAGVYTCRDRILPQNYITIRVIVAKPVVSGTGRPNYPFRPKDPNTIFYTDNDSTVTLPCKIENADATISLHKYEQGKLSCPYTTDGRVLYDRFQGFIIQTRAYKDLEGRYVCVGDFNGELKLMKYKVVRTNEFTSRYVEKEPESVIALNSNDKTSNYSSSSASAFLAKVDTFSNSILSGITSQDSKLNLTAAGLLDPRSEFDLETEDSSILPKKKSETLKTTTATSTEKDSKTKSGVDIK